MSDPNPELSSESAACLPRALRQVTVSVKPLFTQLLTQRW